MILTFPSNRAPRLGSGRAHRRRCRRHQHRRTARILDGRLDADTVIFLYREGASLLVVPVQHFFGRPPIFGPEVANLIFEAVDVRMGRIEGRGLPQIAAGGAMIARTDRLEGQSQVGLSRLGLADSLDQPEGALALTASRRSQAEESSEHRIRGRAGG